MLIYKRRDQTKIEKKRPVSLQSHWYELFTGIINNRLAKKLEHYQLVEPAGFRKGFNTNDNLHRIETIIEKTTKYNIPNATFVDYH